MKRVVQTRGGTGWFRLFVLGVEYLDIRNINVADG